MFDAFIINLFFIIVASSVVFGIAGLIKANLYDLRQARLQRQQLAHPHARHRRKRPQISVVVFAENDADDIVACLESIVATTYKKLELIIIDNASKDTTKPLVKEFIAAHPKLSSRLVAKRTPAERQMALSSVGRWVKGEAILVIDGNCQLAQPALASSVLQLAEPGRQAILQNVRVDHNYQLLGLASKFKAIATIWAKKSGGFIVPGLDAYNYAALYNRDLFKQALKPKNRTALTDINYLRRLSSEVAYDAAGLVAVGKPRTSSRLEFNWSLSGRQLFTTARGLLSLAEPIVACFMLYVALRFDNASYLLLGWLCFTSLIWLAIWSDESRGSWAKLRISILAVVSYSLYILQAVATIIRQLLSLAHKGAGYSGIYKFRPS